jgi:hypothetical protein
MNDPVTIFFERIDAQGYLFATGDLLLGEFLDAIVDAAAQLVAGLGYVSSFERACSEADADNDQQDINRRAREFHQHVPLVGPDLNGRLHVCSEAAMQREHERIIERQRELYGPAARTLMAAEWLAAYCDAGRFREWLDRHSADDALAIVQRLKERRQQKD